MSTSWRIQEKLIDNTAITAVDSEIIGATVIDSYKGPSNFIFINQGEISKVTDIFGYPSKDYPSIQDAIDIVSKSSMWIAAPNKGGKYGGVFVTPSGTIPFVNGVSEKEFTDMKHIACEENIGVTDGVALDFEFQFKNINKVPKNTIKIFLGDTDIGIVISESGEVTDSSSLLAVASSLSTDGLLTLHFVNAPDSGMVLNVQYELDVEDAYFTLFNKNRQADDLRVRVKKSEQVDDPAFEIEVEQYNPVTDEYNPLKKSPYLVGLDTTSKDNMGTNIFIENVFNDFQEIFTATVNNSIFDTFKDDTDFVELAGGERGERIQGSDIASKYLDIQDTDKYFLKFAFDPTCSSECITVFENLRNNYQKYCRFLYCTPNVSPSEIVASPQTYHGGVTANRGLYCYCLTWGVHKDIYQGNDFACSNMGLIAGRLVDVLTIGGGVPAWIDANGTGGILGSSITKLFQQSSETELRQLDTLCFNPVSMDNFYGAMIKSWKTRQVRETVLSYIGQSSLLDTIMDLVIRNVLPPRIGKLIDDTAYSEVRLGCDTICRNYSKYLEDWLCLCDDTNNTDETKNSQRLQVALGLIFKGYAARIDFTVSVERNGVDIKEALTKL